jgi:hypothetical protein
MRRVLVDHVNGMVSSLPPMDGIGEVSRPKECCFIVLTHNDDVEGQERPRINGRSLLSDE